MLSFSVIVTNYNGRKILADCLQSIFQKTEGAAYEVIVVDDASKDDSVDMVKSKFPNVQLIVNPRNVGFSEANNVGMRAAKGRYLLLLNNDTILHNNAFAVMVKFMDAHPEVGIAGGQLLNLQGKPDISYGSFPSLLEALHTGLFLDKLFSGARWVKIKGMSPSPDITKPVEVDYICGADIVIRREVLEEIGFLDLQFRAYCEETDFCYRAKKTGKWKVMYVPEAQIIHLFSMTWGSASERKTQLLYRSYWLYYLKHFNPFYGMIARLLYAFRYAVIFILSVIRSRLNPHKAEMYRTRYKEAGWTLKYALFPNRQTS